MTKKISYWDVKYNQQKNPWINQISNQYSINISEISKPKTIEEKEDDRKIFNVYEFITYQFFLSYLEEDYYFEDSSGISGWLSLQDRVGKHFLKQCEFIKTLSDSQKDYIYLLKHNSFAEIYTYKKEGSRKISNLKCDKKSFEEIWLRIPNRERLVLVFTVKELAWFICTFKSKIEEAKKIAQDFYDSNEEKIIKKFYESISDENIFESIPDWILERLSTKELKELIDCIHDISLEFEDEIFKLIEFDLKSDENSPKAEAILDLFTKYTC